MGKLFIVLLKNNHMKFYDKKPKKAGNYLNSVRLFSVKSKTTFQILKRLQIGFNLKYYPGWLR